MTPTALILTAVAVIFLIGLVAVIVERTEQRDKAIEDYHRALKVTREAQAAAKKAVEQAETFADECKATQAANEILCAELACADEQIRRLSNDLLAAQLLASDAREELAAAPAPVIPLPVVRDDLTALDAEATAYTWPAIARDAFPVREWGEEAEK